MRSSSRSPCKVECTGSAFKCSLPELSRQKQDGKKPWPLLAYPDGEGGDQSGSSLRLAGILQSRVHRPLLPSSLVVAPFPREGEGLSERPPRGPQATAEGTARGLQFQWALGTVPSEGAGFLPEGSGIAGL